MRIGFGTDMHRLEPGIPLVIGGVKIPSEVGAVGHSDADVLLHAVTDSILGAISLGDIGTHFSDKDPKWKNADSRIFLKEAVRLLSKAGYEICNLDTIVNLESPKIRPYIEKMRKVLGAELDVEFDKVSVKAKTGEGLDSVGRCQSIKAEACILLQKVI